MKRNNMTSQTAASDAHEEIYFVTKTLDLKTGTVQAKRQEILDYFHKTFSLYESLFECLNGDAAFHARANSLRHPLIFYYGHTAVFFVNKLNVAGLINTRIDPVLESSLAVGVDEMSWDDLNNKNYDWPTPETVKSYRNKVRNLIDNFIRNCNYSMPIDKNNPLWIILMGIEHERIHLETSTVLVRELSLDLVKPHALWGAICDESGLAPKNELISVEGGSLELGRPKDSSFYGWDNEYGISSEDIASFKASKYLVSNTEFYAFVEDGGYKTEKYWSPEGWAWLDYQKAEYPKFWIKSGETYQYRTMLDVIDMPWNWPVDINCLEAKAFCNWKSEQTATHIRMPTEAEWYKIRALVETDQPDWDGAPGNINLEHEVSSCPVNRHAFTGGFFDVIGNVWQWTETPIDGYDGFEVHEAYDDFSTPTFDGKHNLIKGGSWASTGNIALEKSRYAFRRHFYQHSGLRYVEGVPLPAPKLNLYEMDSLVTKDLEFQYGQGHLGAANFPVACVNAAVEYLDTQQVERAFDIGCGTGRASFELAKYYDHVDAVDISVRLIDPPVNLQKTGAQRFVVPDEGELVSYREVKLADFEAYESVKDNVSFLQGDACNLADKFKDYDLVFASNLIDHLYDPKKFLRDIQDRINPGGLLVIISPYNWTEEYTARDKWLGGFKANTGENYKTLEGITDILTPAFKSVDTPRNIPFVMREAARSFIHGVSEMSVWKKI